MTCRGDVGMVVDEVTDGVSRYSWVLQVVVVQYGLDIVHMGICRLEVCWDGLSLWWLYLIKR